MSEKDIFSKIRLFVQDDYSQISTIFEPSSNVDYYICIRDYSPSIYYIPLEIEH